MHAGVTRKLAMRVDKQVGLFRVTLGQDGRGDERYRGRCADPRLCPKPESFNSALQNEFEEGAPQEGCTEALFGEREGIYSGGRLFQSILSIPHTSSWFFYADKLLTCTWLPDK